MSGSWERNPYDVLIAHMISGPEQTFYEWSEHFLNNIMALPKDLKVLRLRFPEPEISVSRDKAVQAAIQNGARWLWFLDTDIICPPDTLARLMAHNKPIVSGLYVRRHNPPFNEMLRYRTDGFPGLKPINDGEYTPGSLVECDAVATGCMLLQVELFEKMQPFQMTIDGQPARPAWFLWSEWRTNNGLSEDFSFCTRARQQGIQVFCDTSILCRHVGPIKFLPSGNNTLAIEFPGEHRGW